MDESKAFLTALRTLQSVDPKEYEQLLALVGQIGDLEKLDAAKTDFLAFVRLMWPGFIMGNHHKVMAKVIEDIVFGRENRAIVNMAPRMSKSEFFSYLMPAWAIGHQPSMKIIQICATADMAQGWSRKVRDLIMTEDYQRLFPGVRLKADSKAVGRWHTSHGGEYFAVGAEGNVTGKGGDIVIIDDPSGEQQAVAAIGNPQVYDKIYHWYVGGPRQRLQPGGRIAVVQCVAEGERVLNANGVWSPIEKITIGSKVIGYEDGLPVSRTVSAVRTSGEDELVRVTSRSCELKVNRQHPFLVVRGGLEKSPRNQEEVIQSRDWTTEWVLAGDLKPGDMAVTIKSLGVGNYHRPMRFDGKTQMSQEDYWFIGFMFGDGWLINAASRGITGFCWAYGIHEDLNERALVCAKSLFGRDGTKTKHGYYRYDHQDAGRWLFERGFCSGSKIKRLPEWVFRLRPCDKRSFLRGFGDADGWLRPTDRVETWTFGIANRELLDDLRLVARTCGVKVSKIYREDIINNFPPNSPVPKPAVCFRSRFSFRNNQAELRGRYKHQVKSGNGFQKFRFEAIESIEPCGQGQVYDLTVEGVESFIAEGFVVHNSRWATNDFSGRLLKAEKEADDAAADHWKLIELPAILETESGKKSLWPEFWSLAALEATRLALPPNRWNAQYLQQPGNDSSAILKREYWKRWPLAKPPQCDIKIVTMDTAFSDKEGADYTAVTTWGVFEDEINRSDGLQDKHAGKTMSQLFLLDAWKDRVTFPELKSLAHKHYLRWEPDIFIVEAQATGVPLIYELRARGIPVSEYRPSRGSKAAPNSKIMRANGVSDIMASGMVWAPETRWAEDVIEECSNFPGGDNDDYVDTVLMALMRFRQGGFIRLATDDWDDQPIQRRRAYY